MLEEPRWARISRAVARLVIAGLLAVAMVAVATQPSNAATYLTRVTGNECGTVTILYGYASQGNGRYAISVTNTDWWWQSLWNQCGIVAEPYSVVLQWKGKHNGNAFGWTAFPDGYVRYDGDDISEFSGGGYADIRFRACNWNTVTGTVGTCGSS